MHEFNLNSTEEARARWPAIVAKVKAGLKDGGKLCVSIARPNRSKQMNAKFHAMIGDIAKQITFDGNKTYTLEVWKARLVEQFAREKEAMGEPLRHPGQQVISLDGQRLISVRPSTTDFLVKEASDFIEYLYAQGSEMGVQWSERTMQIYQEWAEDAKNQRG